MNRIFSFLFLFVMMLNLAVPLVEQFQGKAVTEYSEDRKEAPDTKEKKEKEVDPFSSCHLFSDGSADVPVFEMLTKTVLCKNDQLVSQFHGSVPELPPEA
jgi:hypothetical protein